MLIDSIYEELVDALTKSQPEGHEAEEGVDFECDKALAFQID